jgi:hypothetical protein
MGQRIYVPISEDDRAELARILRKLQGMKEAPLTKVLLHYGIRNAASAIGAALNEPDEEGGGGGADD